MCWSTGRSADRAAAGQRHPRLAAAREQRPEHEDRRAHRLHQLVGRERPVDARRVERRRPGVAARRRATPICASSVRIVRTSLQLRHVRETQRLGASAARRTGSAAPRSWRRRRAPRRASGTPALDQQLVHVSRPASPRHCAGVSVCHRQRVDLLAHAVAQRRVDELVPLHPVMPSNAALTISASKCWPSPSTSRCSQASPAAMYRLDAVRESTMACSLLSAAACSRGAAAQRQPRRAARSRPRRSRGSRAARRPTAPKKP